MGYAVELYFDDQTQLALQQIRHGLSEAGIPVTLRALDDRPHVSLAVFPNVDCDVLMPLLKDYAGDIPPFDVQLSGVGTFPTDENVLFLIPAASLALITAHRELHRRLERARLASWAYYSPNAWVPHCSVDMNIPDSHVAAALEHCRATFKPLRGRFEQIGIVQFRPVELVATWSLGDAAH